VFSYKKKQEENSSRFFSGILIHNSIINVFNDQLIIYIPNTRSISGKFTAEEIIRWLRIISPERFPIKKLKILMDVSEGEYVFQPAQLQMFDEPIMDLCSSFELVKTAVIHKTPKETEYSLIVSSKTICKNYTEQFFAYREDAIDWLLKD